MDNATNELLASLPERERLTESEVRRVRQMADEAEKQAYSLQTPENMAAAFLESSALRKLLALHASVHPAPAAQSTEPETGKETN